MKLSISQEIEIRNIIQSQLEIIDLNGKNKYNLIDSISWHIKDELAKELSNLKKQKRSKK